MLCAALSGCTLFARSTPDAATRPWDVPGPALHSDPATLQALGDPLLPAGNRPAPDIVAYALSHAAEIAVAAEEASREGRFELEAYGENVDTDALTEAWLRVDEAHVLARLAATPSPEPVPVPVHVQREAAEGEIGPGELHLHVPGTGEFHRVRVFDNGGRMRAEAVREISWALRDRRSDRARTIEPRLITMLYLVGQYYDAQLEVVSGYRIRGVNASAGSRHGSAHACDFRIRGVGTRTLTRHVDGQFAEVGVGYYPTSSFVHLDVRDPSYYWIDRSAPGQRSRTRTRDPRSRGERSADVTLRSPHVTEAELYIPPPFDEEDE